MNFVFSTTERRHEAILASALLALSCFLLLLDLAAESNGAAGCVMYRGFCAGRAVCVLVGLGSPDSLTRGTTGFLPFADGSFDLAVVAGLDRARVPARVVLETERVLRPGRFGVVIRSGPGRIRLVGESAPVTALLRSSDVVGAREVDGSVVVVFKKRGDHIGGAKMIYGSPQPSLRLCGILPFAPNLSLPITSDPPSEKLDLPSNGRLPHHARTITFGNCKAALRSKNDSRRKVRCGLWI